MDSGPLELVERNNTKARDPNSDANSWPQMMKLALTSKPKGVGTSNGCEREKETSFEGSITEGGR